jgi:xylulokinase
MDCSQPCNVFIGSEASLDNALWSPCTRLEAAAAEWCFVQQHARFFTSSIRSPGSRSRRESCPCCPRIRHRVVRLSSNLCPAVLAIDVGTSGTKAGLVSAESGTVLSFARVPQRSYSAAPFHVTQDSREWRKAAISAARKVLRLKHGKCDISIVAVAVTGSMQNLSCALKQRGSLTYPDPRPPLMNDGNVLLYSDSRAIEAARRIETMINREVSPTSLLAKLAYLQDHTMTSTGSELTASQVWALSLSAADSVVFDFGGELVTDPTNASTTDLTRAPHRQYDEELLAAAGLSVFLNALPPITSGGVCGCVSKDIARELGFPSMAGVPLVHAGGDAATATIGAGCYFPNGSQYLYMGTSGWVGRTISLSDITNETAGIRAQMGVFHLGHSGDERWNIEIGSMMSAGTCLDWTAKLLGGISIGELLQLAATAPVGSNGVTFMPYLYGRRCPEPNSRMTGSLHGLRGSISRADVARACLEGVAFGYKACLNSINGKTVSQTVCKGPQLPMKFVGGGARSPLIADILACALGMSLSVGTGEAVGIAGASQFALWNLKYADPASADRTYESVKPTDFTVNPCERSLSEYDAAWLHWCEHFNDPRLSDS